MIIIHGENTVNSREKLVELIKKSESKQRELLRLEAKNLSEAALEESLGASDLFGSSKTIIIEELHSLTTSNRKKALIEQLTQPQIHDLVLWEKRSLTKTMLKKFPKAEVFEYKISKTLFSWLDSLGTKGNNEKKLKLLHEAINTDGEYFCFLMLIRQIRMLIEVASGGKPKGAPFMVSKLKKQAGFFTLEELLSIYKELLEFDVKQKTSTSLINGIAMLDLLSIKL